MAKMKKSKGRMGGGYLRMSAKSQSVKTNHKPGGGARTAKFWKKP